MLLSFLKSFRQHLLSDLDGHLYHLINKKKFRAYDNKEGALRGLHALEEDGLGYLEVKRGRGTSKVNYWTSVLA